MLTPDGRSSHSARQADSRTGNSKALSPSRESSSQTRSSQDYNKNRTSVDSNKEQNESSPLILPTREHAESPPSSINVSSPQSSPGWEGDAEETKSSFYLFLLTLAIGG